MWMYVIAIVILIVSSCTIFGILLDELNAPKNTGARVCFWVGSLISASILLLITIVEAANTAEKLINKPQAISELK